MSRTAYKAVHRTPVKFHAVKPIVHTATLKLPIPPLPDRSMLEPQPEPDCTFRGPLSSPATAEEMRMKLDYEQQCYRQAESITRDRLKQLQSSIDNTIKAISRR
jgi:hypothetical protein